MAAFRPEDHIVDLGEVTPLCSETSGLIKTFASMTHNQVQYLGLKKRG